MTPSSMVEASRPNPALKPFTVLIGEWTTVGAHGLVPGTTYHGRTSFAWLEGGAFLMMRSEIDEPDIPSGIAVGHDHIEAAGRTRKLAMRCQEQLRGVHELALLASVDRLRAVAEGLAAAAPSGRPVRRSPAPGGRSCRDSRPRCATRWLLRAAPPPAAFARLV